MLVLIGALIIGLSLGLFGSGGSILTVPVLLYLVGMPASLAIASSLLIVALISLFGSIHNMFRRLISWRHVLWFGVPGMLGTYGGAWLGTLVDSRWQLLVFASLMVVAAIMMWRSKVTMIDQPKTFHHIKVIADGLVVGAITGFVGVGGGFLIVPALVLLAGLPLHIGVATSLMIIALKSFVGFAKYYSVFHAQGLVFDWHAITIMVVAGILGSYVGGWLNRRLPKAILQKGFAVFLAIMAGVVIYQSVL
ncbi:sulfite exporter TauE/SafE family protein [Alishewanella sp. 16-MA]|uniref:Probable membrane transporter protein n=1 Tax=Alishewanella maricola TaxID=2795740 RepID=A0ABS8C7R9_9ALTE|nr:MULTISPECIES: sulfite exporter TauE/SafE family protein [Alishewanella]MDP4945946.1 sulfite exporter TauE/SafE family protein [Alishewanella sp.]MCB5227990.1 sulfite exporter TauE/SafE family protein [Alishewanella maricola]MDP5034775.1 sulfite exporter TauE/SafE family protein [Alishewanella sp.]MDP5186509.1 sulfite exporter TauE/SafE family protein [Alishewanella sp.]MDP5459817.1 sulfite exporter TauE/SafE family protein [Alishewanella sp. SMS8]